MVTISNNILSVTVRPQGAELTSLFHKPSNTEHLWQADPSVWAWHAPTLFPVVGRCLDDKLRIDGAEYTIEKHGFVRRTTFTLVEQTNDSVWFAMADSESTWVSYPYCFRFLIGYTVQDNCLTVTYKVENKNDQELFFSVGGHPAFATPFYKGETYSDYYLEFEQNEVSPKHLINEEGYFDGRTEAIIQQNRIALRNNLFAEDALIFKDLKSRSISIKSTKHSASLSVEFKDFDYLGLWAKTNASYVCIEPWLGCSDTVGNAVDIKDKEGIVRLPAAETFSCSYKICISA